MIFRAVFWIALVSMLMPHEPDLGYGRPHLGIKLPEKLGAWTQAEGTVSDKNCGGYAAACSAGLSFLDSFQSVAVRSLSDVKADIERSRREDFIRRHSS